MITSQKVIPKHLTKGLILVESFQKSNQSGFTIIESLLAIIVVTILMVSLTPIIVVSVATRVQARRVEKGTEAAKTYIDGVISGTIPAPPVSTSTLPSAFPAPSTGTLTCSTNNACTSPANSSYTLYCMDGDGIAGCTSTSISDLIIQSFGYNPNSTATADNGYTLGVRVYRADAFKDSVALKQGNNNQARTYTGGLGDPKAPLIEITTEIPPKKTLPQFRNFCDRIPNSSC